LLALVKSLGLESYELGGENIEVREDGSLHSAGDDDEVSGFDAIESMTEWSAAHSQDDLSFAEWLAGAALPEARALAAAGFVEGFNAADAKRISVQALAMQQRAEDEIDGQSASHVKGGYEQVPQRLAQRLEKAGGAVRLRSQVVRVAWSAGAVTVSLADGEEMRAECVVVALPLGVLQGGAVRFDPAPGDVLTHASRMAMGQVCRVNLQFKRRWWAELEHPLHEQLQEMSFLLPERRMEGAHFNVFWSGFPSVDPVLTAWSGGTAAAHFDSLDDHAIAHIACGDLARIFGLTQEQVLDELVGHHRYDWGRDPLFGGAYSWVPVGAVDASKRMTEPVEGTLFFAGEHTDVTGHWGTVHGAMRSGLRAAEQVLRG
jgi:monoamine oxidase